MTGPLPLPLPFSGLRVVAVEQAVSGPFCTRQFADLGAEVIKIERPDGGDFARGYDGAMNGVSAYFAWLNRGKQSVVLDLKTAKGRDRLHGLVLTADVFVHNLAPGAVERLGLGYDALSIEHARLVWVGISGFGPDGPYRDRKAYDMLIQAESGVVSVTGTPNEPAKVGISVADIASGLYAYSSALAALYGRERTGRGERIDISMLECMTEWMMPPLYTYLGTGRGPARAGLRHNLIVPYGAYPCADGQVLFAVQSDAEFRRFCEAVLHDVSLSDHADYMTNAGRLVHREALETRITSVLAVLPVVEVVARLERGGIANAVVNDVAAVAAHPQLAARERWTTVQSFVGDIPALLPPHNLASSPPVMGRVPALGEHTDVA
ncbi:MAG: CaiB/BaiF CoA-transferase family protein [Gemmatimonadaceae bacterium]|nr:CaiB/BaiF CoA-transferase family protein [Gemmatimonadaceae bacterium]